MKNPISGKVKTRLAKDVGNERALEVYLMLLDITRKQTENLNANKYLFYHQEIVKNDLWDNDKFIKLQQSDGDLGDRIMNAFIHVLAKCGKAIIIGSDCPDLTEDLITDAFAALDKSDTVIGPTHDGGYYLIGMKELHSCLFKDIAWSTDSVCSTTIERIRSNGNSYHLLPMLSDLDNIEDLIKSGLDRKFV